MTYDVYRKLNDEKECLMHCFKTEDDADDYIEADSAKEIPNPKNFSISYPNNEVFVVYADDNSRVTYRTDYTAPTWHDYTTEEGYYA